MDQQARLGSHLYATKEATAEETVKQTEKGYGLEKGFINLGEISVYPDKLASSACEAAICTCALRSVHTRKNR